jgi:hypothetical protein
VAHKRRKLELRAGHTSARGRKGTASGYSLRAVRAAERELAAQAETAYRTMVTAWQPSKPTRASLEQGDDASAHPARAGDPPTQQTQMAGSVNPSGGDFGDRGSGGSQVAAAAFQSTAADVVVTVSPFATNRRFSWRVDI